MKPRLSTSLQFLFDGGRVVDYLKKVKVFLDANPNEVLTLLFTNPEGLSIKDVWKPAFDDAGKFTRCIRPQLSSKYFSQA